MIGGQILQPNGTVAFVPGAKARTEVDPTSTNAGIVYYVFRDLGVFANYSETFSTPGSGPNFIDGREPGTSQSTGCDVGFKLELFNGTYKYTSNVYATYTLPGRWRNVSVGGGANLRGRQKIGNVQVLNGVANNQPYKYLWADAYHLVRAHATYRHRFSDKLTARFQLNISNLLDSDKLMYRGYGTYRVGGLASNPLLQLPNNVTMPEPRKFTLSATFDF